MDTSSELGMPENAASLTPEGINLLERLSKLCESDCEHQNSWDRWTFCPIDRDRRVDNVLRARYESRRASARLFEDLVRRSELQVLLSAAIKTDHQLDFQRRTERRVWLERLENQVLEEKNFILTNGRSLRKDDLIQHQIKIWDAELVARQKRWRSALKFVLRLKAIEQAPNEEPVLSVMNRLVGPSFPTELLLKVIETLVGSQMPYCGIAKSDKLETLAGKCFNWPRNISDSARGCLQRMATKALLKLSTIKIPEDWWTILPVLRGEESHIRRLVLELDTTRTPRAGGSGSGEGSVWKTL